MTMPVNRMRTLLLAANAILLSAVLLLFLFIVDGGLSSPWLEFGALVCGVSASTIVILLWRSSKKKGDRR